MKAKNKKKSTQSEHTGAAAIAALAHLKAAQQH